MHHQVGYQASYNFYNFKQGEPAFDTFDVSSCFGDFLSNQPFTLEFSGALFLLLFPFG